MFDLEGTDFSSHVVPTNEEKCTCGILNSVTEAQNSTQNLQIFPWQVTEIFYKHVLIFFCYKSHPLCYVHLLCEPNRNVMTK